MRVPHICGFGETAQNGRGVGHATQRVIEFLHCVAARIRVLCALLLCIGLAASSFAQNRANFPWWNSPVKSDLGLTSEQNQKIRQIVRSYRDRLLDARNNAQKAEQELEDMLNDQEVNPDAAKPVVERLANARANANRVFLEMSVQLRSVLTFDQWRQLVHRWDEVQKKRPSDVQTPPE